MPCTVILCADELRAGLVTVVDGKKVKVENDSRDIIIRRNELVAWDHDHRLSYKYLQE